MGYSCGICRCGCECPLCEDCRSFYTNRATNDTLPHILRPYSSGISIEGYAELHRLDKAFQGGKNDPNGTHKAHVEKITREIAQRVGALAQPIVTGESLEEQHKKNVAVYLKTFD